MFGKSLRVALIALIVGWGVALLVAVGWAALQYQEVARSFLADQIATEFQSRIDRELWRGSLLLYVQTGVLCGVVWWRVATTGANGLIAGMITAVVQALLAIALSSSLLFWIPMAVVIAAVGVVAQRWRVSSTALPSLGTSSAERPRP